MATAEQSTRRKRSLLAAVMLAVLVVSVAVAWVLGALARRRVGAGVEILAGIRRDGLAKHWPEPLRVDWYLTYGRDEAKPSGWGAMVRGRDSGGFTGMALFVFGQEVRLEKWTLSPDATSGEYHAHSGGGRQADTSVKLEKRDDGEEMDVTVIPHGGQRLPGQGRASKNYLPEGTLELAVALVAAGRANAQFAMVYNESPNIGGRIEFGTVRIRYLSTARWKEGGEARRVRATFMGRRQNEREYEVGPDGEMLWWSGPLRRVEAAEEEELLRRFGDVRGVVRRRLQKRLLIIWERARLDRPPEQPEVERRSGQPPPSRFFSRSSAERRINSSSGGSSSFLSLKCAER